MMPIGRDTSNRTIAGILLLGTALFSIGFPSRALGQVDPAPPSAAPSASAQPTKSPTFEVASIKPYKPQGNFTRTMIQFTPDGVNAEGLSLKSLICIAYGVSDFQVSGGPAWLDSDKYDMHAKMDPSFVEAFGKLPPD